MGDMGLAVSFRLLGPSLLESSLDVSFFLIYTFPPEIYAVVFLEGIN